jgi:multicomponent Na+:H+ antiporter subunit C
MEALLAVTIGVLVAGAVYLMLARNVLRFIFGLVLISNAANLTIFTAGRLTPEANRR